jgi:hypothetical protein
MYAELFHNDSGLPLSENLSRSDRFCMYKTGPVLWINVINKNNNQWHTQITQSGGGDAVSRKNSKIQGVFKGPVQWKKVAIFVDIRKVDEKMEHFFINSHPPPLVYATNNNNKNFPKIFFSMAWVSHQ